MERRHTDTSGQVGEQGATQVYWEGKQGETGLVLCLARNAK
jgi:hypothetical protein